MKKLAAGLAAGAVGAAVTGLWPVATLAAGGAAWVEGRERGFFSGFEEGYNLGSQEPEIDWDEVADRIPEEPSSDSQGLVKYGEMFVPLWKNGQLQITLGAEVVNGQVDTRKPVTLPLEEAFHWAVFGLPRSGKSVMARLVVYQLMLAELNPLSRGRVKFLALDATGITFNPQLFNGVKNMWGPVATSEEDILSAFSKLKSEKDRRAELFKSDESYPEKLSEFNRFQTDSEKNLPFIFIFFEEFAAFAQQQKPSFLKMINSFLWEMPKYGMYLCALSQNATKEVMGKGRDSYYTRILVGPPSVEDRGMLQFSKEATLSEIRPGRAWGKFSNIEKEFQIAMVDKQDLVALAKMLKRRSDDVR